MPKKPYDIASEVSAQDGDVLVNGPDGVDVALTPGAAIETSDRLLSGALEAQGQRVETRGQNERKKPGGKSGKVDSPA